MASISQIHVGDDVNIKAVLPSGAVLDALAGKVLSTNVPTQMATVEFNDRFGKTGTMDVHASTLQGNNAPWELNLAFKSM